MRTTFRWKTPCLVAGAAALLAATACGRDDRAASADGAASPPPAAGGGVAGGGVAARTLDVDQGEDRIEAALRADSTLAPFQLDADDERGRIAIEGVVATEAQKARAAELAATAAPGLQVENRVRVDANAARREAADAAADEAEDRVEAALDADPALAAFDLDADDEKGGLVLEGTVQTAAQRTQAEEIAKRVAPGLRIDNRIRVQ